jgi:hypothetical protein
LSVAHFCAGTVSEHDDPIAALAHYDETIALVRAGAAVTVYAPALSWSAQLLARAGEGTEALHRLRDAIVLSRHEADVPFLMGSVVSTLVVFDLLNFHETIGELAGIITLGQYKHLNIGGFNERYGVSETIARLRTDIGAEMFDQATARGAAMDAEEIATFTLSSIDQAMPDMLNA